MSDSREDILRQIATARVANEAEVETKIVLHLLRLLGYSDVDRADKVPVRMQFGREVKTKEADFILYDGPDRTIPNALLTVETKAVGESLAGAEEQARSYATWAGTPFILVCNGTSVLVAQFLAGLGTVKSFVVSLDALVTEFDRIRAMIGRAEAVLAKERLSYVGEYLPDVERLPPAEFLQEYLVRLADRFRWGLIDRGPLSPPSGRTTGLLQIPVNVRRLDMDASDDYGAESLSALLLERTNVFIDGQPGAGKSTLCRRMATVLAERSSTDRNRGLVPIYLNLSRGIPMSVSAAFHRACEDLGVRVFPELYKRVLGRAHVILLLDGLDEVPEGGNASEALVELLAGAEIAAVALTSRPQTGLDNKIRCKFIHFRVRQLNEPELASVLHSHVRSPETAAELLSASTSGLIPDLHSAMTALMAIRVANEIPNWRHLSAYRLYAEYVGVLHSYFNAPDVRGGAATHAVRVEAVINALATAAFLLREAEADGYKLSFGDITRELNALHNAAAEAFLNCGLLTSDQGRAAFVHRSFEDFGLAVRLIVLFRQQGISGLNQRHLSDEAYRLAASELSLTDESTLIRGLMDGDKRIRKRASALLSRMDFSSEAENALWERMSVEQSERVWSSIARGLLRAVPARFERFLSTNATVLSPRRLSSLSWAMRRSGDGSILQTLLSVCESRVSHHLALAAFDIAVATNDRSCFNRLTNIYSRLNLAGRRAIARLLCRKHDELRNSLMLQLLQDEVDLRTITVLLTTPALLVEGTSNQSLMVRLTSIIGDRACPTQLNGRERRHLRVVATRLRRRTTPSVESEGLAEVCEWMGRKVQPE